MAKLNFEDWKEIVLGQYRFAYDSDLRRLWASGLSPQEAIDHCVSRKLFHRRSKNGGKVGRPATVGVRRLPFWNLAKVQRYIMKAVASAGIVAVLKCQKHSLDDDSVAFLRELKERLENDIVKACAPDE